MERLTVLLCCNVTGTELLKPVLCGKVMRQRAWGPRSSENAWSPDKYMHWVKTRKAWMDKDTFNAWLKDVRDEFKRQGRSIFMIMDNTGAHSIHAPEMERTVVRNVTVSLNKSGCYRCTLVAS